MKDMETGTFWSQVSGRAIHGPENGSSLEPVPAVVTTWGEWLRLHPDTLVLEKEPLEESPYEAYFASDRSLGIFEGINPDPRLPGKEIVLGVRLNGSTVAYSLERSEERAFLNDTVGGEPILVVFDTGSHVPAVYSRRLGEKTIEAARWLRLDDREGGTVLEDLLGNRWNPLSGEAVEGPLKGELLQPVPAFTVYWFVWARFYPETALR